MSQPHNSPDLQTSRYTAEVFQLHSHMGGSAPHSDEPENLSAYGAGFATGSRRSAGLDCAKGWVRSTEDELVIPTVEKPEQDADPGPLVCRIPMIDASPEAVLESIPDELCRALDGVEELDPYDLAVCLFELALFRPAVLLLERSIRRYGPRLGACELMARCLLALGRPELAELWLLSFLDDPGLDGETLFEFTRLASLCRMRIQEEDGPSGRLRAA